MLPWDTDVMREEREREAREKQTAFPAGFDEQHGSWRRNGFCFVRLRTTSPMFFGRLEGEGCRGGSAPPAFSIT